MNPPDQTTLKEWRSFACELADLADAVTLPAFRTRLGVAASEGVERKGDGSPVTDADRETERVMRRAITGRYPDHAVLGEEGGWKGPADAPTWVLDPIDGTKSFIRGVPVFATLIAVTVDDRPAVGVVSAPALGSRWDGIVGGPARQDGIAVRVSTVGRLADANVSFGGLNYFHECFGLEVVTTLAARTARQRGYGDFWQHCLVATGGLDLAVEAAVNRWDLAAPKAIVEAAGGKLTALDGADTYTAGNALSSNSHLHAAALELLQIG